MRKICVLFLVFILLVSSLTGCTAAKILTENLPDPSALQSKTESQTATVPGAEPESEPQATAVPESSTPESEAEPQTTPEPEAEADPESSENAEEQVPENPIGEETTYWVAKSYSSPDSEEPDAIEPLDPDHWTVDLLIYVNGTARMRDIHEKIALTDDSFLNLSWESDKDGNYSFVSALYSDPVLTGKWENGSFVLDYMGTVLYMEQADVPTEVGELYSPAELAGTWLLVSGETDGDYWDAVPHELTSIVFKVSYFVDSLIMMADTEKLDREGEMQSSAYGLTTEPLPQPLYAECPNQSWSLRIDSPEDDRLSATLLSYNELQVQRVQKIEGDTFVSYLKYLRLNDIVSWQSPESMDLEQTNWSCMSYRNERGEELPPPTELENFSVSFDADGKCWVYSSRYDAAPGLWSLGSGGVLLIRSNEMSSEPFWFGGVVSAYTVSSENAGNGEYDGVSIEYEMTLYCSNGGILKMQQEAFG